MTYFAYALFFLTTLGVTMNSPTLLRRISHLYQYGYWCWNMGYAGLGEEGIAHSFRAKSRILCRKEMFTPKFEETLLDLRKFIEREGRILQRHPRSRTTYKVNIEGVSYIVKESFKLPRLFCILFPSRYSRIAWNNAQLAKELGLSACDPVALVEFGYALQYSSYLIYPCVGETLAEHTPFQDWLDKLEGVILQQKELRLIHPDFRPTNVLVLEDGSISYIDIDEMHRYPALSYVFQARLRKELLRFTQLMREERGEETFSFNHIKKL